MKDKKTYHDGSHEDWLYDRVVNDRETDPQKLLKENSSWFLLNQVSPARENLLRPFDFKGDTLEIGAGCGPLTGMLLEKSDSVMSNELSSQRAAILKARHNSSKLTVNEGNLNDLKIDKKFDNVVVVGVLEYAGEFYKTENPFIDFLAKCKSFLKPSGKLFLAIENKIGIKYLAGCAEDHYGRLLEGIHDYPDYFGRRTFSKEELRAMLQAVGFNHIHFNYPFPDYKFPIEIHSDWSIKNVPIENNGFFPTQDLSMPREYIFTEALLMRTLKLASIAEQFPNSFIVHASEQDIFNDNNTEILYSKLSSNRVKSKKKFTSIIRQGTGNKVIKSHETKLSGKNDPIRKMLEIIFQMPAEKKSKEGIEVDFIAGKRMDQIAFEHLINRDTQSVKKIFTELKSSLIKAFGSKESPIYIDLNLSNIISDGDKQFLIDYEAILESPVDVDTIILRSFIDFYSNNFQAIFTLYNEVSNVEDFYTLIFGDQLTKKESKIFLDFEDKISRSYFQRGLDLTSLSKNYSQKENYINIVEKNQQTLSELETMRAKYSEIERERDHLKKSLDEAGEIINNLVTNIENSKAMKAAKMIKKILRKK